MRIAIVEDDESCAEHLRKQLKKYQQDHHMIIQISSYSNGLNFIENYVADFDAVFMDIEMPLIDGIEVSRRLRGIDGKVPIVFITRHAQHAISGYDVSAVDFVIKPVEYDRLAKSIDKINEKNEARRSFITIVSKNHTVRIAHRDIVYVESFNHWCVFHTVSQNTHRMLISMKRLEEMVSRSGFLRCNNSYLINATYVTGWNKSGVVLGDITLPISRGRRKLFLNNLAKIIGEM